MSNKQPSTISDMIHNVLLNDQVEKAEYILAQLEPFYNCCVAGGAPRDWYLGNPANDIDIYIKAGSVSANKIIKDIEYLLAVKLNKVGAAESFSYSSNPNIDVVYECNMLGEQVQFIVWNSEDDPYLTFPLSICQAKYEIVNKLIGDNVVQEFEIKTSSNFKVSLLHSCVFVTGEIYNKNHRYISKILSKFPDWYWFGSEVEFANYLLELERIKVSVPEMIEEGQKMYDSGGLRKLPRGVIL